VTPKNGASLSRRCLHRYFVLASSGSVYSCKTKKTLMESHAVRSSSTEKLGYSSEQRSSPEKINTTAAILKTFHTDSSFLASTKYRWRQRLERLAPFFGVTLDAEVMRAELSSPWPLSESIWEVDDGGKHLDVWYISRLLLSISAHD